MEREQHAVDQPEVEPLRDRCALRVTPASYAGRAETKPVSVFNDDKRADIAKALAAEKKAAAAEKRRAKKGRTLTPAEIAAEAAKLGFPVSQRAA